MKMKSISTAVAFMFLAVALLPVSVFGSKADGKTKLYLVTPPVQIGQLAAGDTFEGTFTLAERTDTPAYVNIYTSPYSMQESDYTPMYEGVENYRNSIKDWITFPNGIDFTVPADGEIEIPFVVTIPRNALGGSQYCAIIIENIKQDTNSDENNSTSTPAVGRVALPIFADILGDDMNPSGEIISWNTNSIFLSPPLKSNFIINNTGNILFSVAYKYEVFNFFSSEIAFVDESTKAVFPDTKRTIEHEWAEAPLLGLFNVKETITFLDQTEEFSRLVLIIPLFVIIIFLIIIVLGIILIINRAKQRRKQRASKSDTI